MRRVCTVGVLAALLLAPALSAVGQTDPAAPAATPAANPALDAAKAAAAALGAEEMAAIQRSLIWTGDLNSLATGEFGKRSFDAIRAFQKRIKAKDTGILLPAEREALDKAAARAIAAYGFKEITERGVTLSYPAKLAIKRSEGKNGPKFASPDSNVTVDVLEFANAAENFEALFARLKTERTGRKVTYSLLKPDFFVVAGSVDGKSFYQRFLKTDGGAAGFSLGWDPKLSPDFDRVSIAMAGSLKLAGSASTPAKPAEPQKVAEPPKPVGPPVPLAAGAPSTAKTGPGVLVSAKGDILTYASLIAGCSKVTLADGSSAAVVAGDLANDVALARLDKPGAGTPVPWRLAPLAQGETVTAGATATTVAALIGPGGDSRRVALAAGGAGGLFDAKGALSGLAAADGKPAALKSLFTVAFLRANGAESPAGDSATPASAAVTLTCTPGS